MVGDRFVFQSEVLFDPGMAELEPGARQKLEPVVSALKQIEATVATLLGFAQKNPGMTRVLIGDALVNEDERLQARVNQLVDRLEASLRQSARLAVGAGTLPADWDVNAYANAVIAFVIGRWHQFAKSGFKRAPMEGWPQQWRVFAA